MSSHFEWVTDEDEAAWEQQQPAPPPGPPGRSRRWLYLLIGLLAIALAAVVVSRQVDQRVTEATERIEADVLAVDNLARSAAAEGDAEVLITLLSGRDPRWTQAQSDLLEAGLLFEGAGQPFGFEARPGTISGLQVELSSQLNAALVRGEQAYTIRAGEETTDTITLEQVLVYRQGQRSWLLSPPDEEFWGSWSTTNGPRVTVAYPGRDEEFAVRFALDLERVLVSLCNLLDSQECLDDVRVNVRLDSDPRALLALQDPEAMFAAGGQLNLPTPTLIGTPVDEAGYQALFRGYAVLVVEAALTDWLDYDCCAKIAFYRPLVDGVLGRLELRPYPLHARDLLTLINYPAIPDRAQEVWHADELAELPAEEQLFAYAFVQYLLDEREVDLEQALQTLLQSPTLGAFIYSSGIAPGVRRGDNVDFSLQAWSDYLRREVRAYQETAETAVPLPEQDLLLYCFSEEQATGALYQYDLATESMTQVLDESAAIGLVGALPGDDGAMITRVLFDEQERPDSALWRPGAELIEITTNDPNDVLLVFNDARDPRGEYVSLLVFPMDGRGTIHYALLDANDCQDTQTCQPRLLPGRPVWSPDGSRLLMGDDNGLLWLAGRDTLESESLHAGRMPFWLTNEIYGYLPDGGGQVQIVGPEGQATLLFAEDLAALLPVESQRFRLAIQGVMAHPERPNLLFINAYNGLSDRSMLFMLTRPDTQDWFEVVAQSSEQLTLLFEAGAVGFDVPGNPLAVNGRWLVSGPPTDDFDGELLLYDLDTQSSWSLPRINTGIGLLFYDWSADGTWLAWSSGMSVTLAAPAGNKDGSPYFRYVLPTPEDLFCTTVVWINK